MKHLSDLMRERDWSLLLMPQNDNGVQDWVCWIGDEMELISLDNDARRERPFEGIAATAHDAILTAIQRIADAEDVSVLNDLRNNPQIENS